MRRRFHTKSVLKVLMALLLALVWACEPEAERRPTPQPPQPEPPVNPDDPITQITVPGAYGVEGGTVLFEDAALQRSLLRYGDGQSLRILNPGTMSVVSISGLPDPLRAGARVSFLYRVSKEGISQVARRYEGVEVLKTADGLTWLKVNDATYFILEL